MTINNVQGIGTDQWVALYYANGVYGFDCCEICLSAHLIIITRRFNMEEHNH